MKKSFLSKMFLNAVAIYITASFVKGVEIRDFVTAVVATVILGIANALIRPVLLILSLPINLMTLGLFTFVVNGVMLLITSSVTKGFYVAGLSSAIVASIIISVVSSILSFLFLE